jgi:hypothetical protein
MGFGLDTCLISSVDDNGIPTNSMKYILGNTHQVVMQNYNNTDCSGTPVSSFPLTVPSTCMPDSTNNLSTQFVVSTTNEPWKELSDNGMINK